MNVSNLSQMHAALSQADTGVREFLVLWTEQLDEDRQAQLHRLTSNGIRLGVHFVVGGGAPVVEITAVDSRGSHTVLERLDFQKSSA